MRHLKRTAKLGRQFEHRNAMLANMVCSLIKHKRVTTTLAKAKAARPVAEKMVTLGKAGSIHARRQVAARLHTRDGIDRRPLLPRQRGFDALRRREPAGRSGVADAPELS